MALLSDDVDDSDRNTVIEKCGQYLGQNWKPNNLTVKRFSDGFFNKIFLCQQNCDISNDLDDNNDDTKGQQCNAVVVKLALEEDLFLYNPFLSTVSTLIISESGLSPKVLGCFENGMIFEYIESRTYNYMDDDNLDIVKLLAHKLAKFHSLDVPIPRDGTYKWIDKVFDEYFRVGLFSGLKQVIDSIKTCPYESLRDLNLDNELTWMKSMVVNAPKILVLSHCDFNRGNILIKQNAKQIDLMLIDFDFTSYNFRGIDFGRYFSSWRHKDPHFGSDGFPTDQQMYPFIDAYIDEWDGLTGHQFSKNKLNSRDHLIKEAKLFTLVGILIDVLFCLWKISVEPNVMNDFLTKAESRYSFYLSLKQQFLKDNALP